MQKKMALQTTLIALAFAASGSGLFAQTNALPPEFKQLLPRGAIAAVTNPKFVPASEAKISGNNWVLGVVIDGVAHAYSLNLLNSHEVVNDWLGNTPIAAVW